MRVGETGGGGGRVGLLASSCSRAADIQHALLLPAFDEQLGLGHRFLRDLLHVGRPTGIDADLLKGFRALLLGVEGCVIRGLVLCY